MTVDHLFIIFILATYFVRDIRCFLTCANFKDRRTYYDVTITAFDIVLCTYAMYQIVKFE